MVLLEELEKSRSNLGISLNFYSATSTIRYSTFGFTSLNSRLACPAITLFNLFSAFLNRE